MRLDELYIRDPFILPYEDTYYMYGKIREEHTRFVVYTSKDLRGWSEPTVVFDRPEAFWGTKDFWAPEVHLYQGKFYMFASFKSDDRRRATHILVADAPIGPFKPVSSLPATPPEWECLDGTLYVDEDGTPYMVFCHEWTQVGNGTVCYAELKNDLTEFVTEPKVMFAAGDFAFTEPISREIEGDGYVTDGPFLYRCNNGDLRMIWSSFGQNGYFVSVLKSDNARLDGEWKAENLLFDRHGGHGMIFRSFEGQLKLTLHTPNYPSGMERAVLFDLQENEQGGLSICQE